MAKDDLASKPRRRVRLTLEQAATIAVWRDEHPETSDPPAPRRTCGPAPARLARTRHREGEDEAIVLLVRPATRQDSPAIAELLDELDRFYGATEIPPVEERAVDIDALLFRDRPAAHVMLAWDGDKVVGMATYSFLWPAAGVTASLYLKELYVAASHRRRGVGGRLMDRLRQIAREAGCSRIEWTTDEDNADAQRFYERLGFLPHPGKIFFRTSVA